MNKCIDTIGYRNLGRDALDLGSLTFINEANDLCGDALDLLQVDGFDGTGLSDEIALRGAYVSLFALKILDGSATEADAAEIDDAAADFVTDAGIYLEKLR